MILLKLILVVLTAPIWVVCLIAYGLWLIARDLLGK